MSVGSEILRLKVTLKECKPTVWREIEIASSMTLAGLHDVLQTLMGWEDYHLWAFEFGRRRFELPDPDGMDPMGKPSEDPGHVTVGELLVKKNQKLAYNYDFGDDWWIEIEVQAVVKPEPKVRYPRCITGERSGPPEDCGGPGGYQELLAARRNPKSSHAKELLEWAGEDWDPDAFDLAAINEALSALPVQRGLH